MFTPITYRNLIPMCIYNAIRNCVGNYWINNKDLYLWPNDDWKNDKEFQNNCLVYCLFNNNVESGKGENHWIPFTESEVNTRDTFSSHFMSDYILGKYSEDSTKPQMHDLFMPVNLPSDNSPLVFSSEAQEVIQAGRELWKYYHIQEKSVPDASLYDIRMYFQGTKASKTGKVQMNSDSSDSKYTELLADLRKKQKVLASKIETKVYEYGFLKK